MKMGIKNGGWLFYTTRHPEMLFDDVILPLGCYQQ